MQIQFGTEGVEEKCASISCDVFSIENQNYLGPNYFSPYTRLKLQDLSTETERLGMDSLFGWSFHNLSVPQCFQNSLSLYIVGFANKLRCPREARSSIWWELVRARLIKLINELEQNFELVFVNELSSSLPKLCSSKLVNTKNIFAIM